MAGPIVVAIDGDNRGLSRAIDGSQSKISGLGRAAGMAGRAIAAGAVVAGAAVVALGVKSVQAASDAQQSLGASETVFGKFANRVIKDSNRAALTFGLSANEYRESANLIGSLFRNQGVAADELAGKTRGMIKTGSDLAATYGGTTREAVEALGSAFKGEFDPLERYGISIKQSAINAELAARGQEKLEGAALKAAQQQATSRLIMEQSSRAAGAFARESDTLAHVQQVLGAQSENLQAKIGGALTPSLTRLGNAVSADVMPYLSDLADKYAPKVAGWIDKIADKLPDLIAGFRGGGDSTSQLSADLGKVTEAAGELGPQLRKASAELPSMHDGLTVFGAGLSFAADHVDELRTALPYLVAGLAAYKTAQLANQLVGRDSLVGFALQIGSTRSLTVANRQLAASLQGVNAASGGTVAGAGAAATKVSKLGAAAKVAGGAAGVGLLSAGVGKAETKLGALETTAGAALLGFSVGGPWGAAIGAGAGGLFSLWKAIDHTGDSASKAQPEFDKYAGSLDKIAASSGRARRAEMYRLLQQDKEVIPAARMLGIETNVLIASLNGNDKATRKITNSWRQHQGVLDAVNLEKVTSFLREQGFQLKLHENELAEDRAALKKWDGKLEESGGKIPKTNKLIKSLGGVDPSGKWVETFLGDTERAERTGRDKTARNNKTLGQLGNVKPSNKWLGIYGADLDRAGQLGRDKQGRNNAILRDESGKARADLSGFSSSLVSGIISAGGRARSQAASVGASISAGVAGGIASNAWQAVNAAASMVADAIAAARSRRGADAHSPSRKGIRLGRDIVRGLVVGVRGGSKELGRELIELHKLVREKVGGDRGRALLAQLGNEERALRNLAARYHDLAGRLEQATSRLKSLRDAAAGARQGALDYANITGVGGEQQTADSIAQGLLERVEVVKAFQSNIRKLTKAGLNRAQLRQIIEAGPELGNATAEAIMAGGAKSIRELNRLQGQLNTEADKLAGNTGRALYDGGLKAAAGVVNGLKRRQGQIERHAERIGNKIARAVRRGVVARQRQDRREDRRQDRIEQRRENRIETHARRPQLSDRARAGGAGRREVTLRLSADQISQLQRGKQIRADLDAYEGRGGRRGVNT